jgi:hypothetical protein
VGLVRAGELALAELTYPSGMLRAMTPTAELIHLPEGYGNPTVTLAWTEVLGRLTAAERYWLATSRPDGRPHVVPTDGLWTAAGFHFGGHPDTVHLRNLRANPAAAVHLEDALAAVIVEGTAEWTVPSRAGARELAAASKAKYGWGAASSYADGVWVLRPARVLAWTALNRDATRFTFPGGPAPRGP